MRMQLHVVNNEQIAGLILGLCPANEKHCYKPILIGLAQT